jgi:hypothetical protein
MKILGITIIGIINVPKEGQIHPKRPPDVTSCSTEQGPGAWGSACSAMSQWRKNRFSHVEVWSAVHRCVYKHILYIVHISNLWIPISQVVYVMLSVLSVFFFIRTVSKRDTFQLDVNIGTQSGTDL